MKFKIESFEFTIEELLHHISKGRSEHFKQPIIDALSDSERERSSLLYRLSVASERVCQYFVRADNAERERDELRKTLQATQGGATEAIKNVMRLQEEISRLDKESQRLSDQLNSCSRDRLEWIKRAKKAEEELAIRIRAGEQP